MKNKIMSWAVFMVLFLSTSTSGFLAGNPVGGKSITTNKDKLLTLAVQGQVAHPQPSRYYLTTWDGKPKMGIGIGGINYNLRIGDKVFGWASTDRATVGVATEGGGEDRFREAWLTMTSIGSEVRILGGEAKGAKGIVVGKFGGYVLVQFDDETLDKLAIGDGLQVKARGIGLQVEGFKDVFVHGLVPEVLEKLAVRTEGGRLEIPIVREIPASIVGGGSGGTSLYGNWHIQTCYPPDIKAYGLEELRFGDLVLLKDTQTDYGKGYYKGAATIGVVCSGPSDVSGLGIGVTPILSSKSGTLVGRLDPEANIGTFLGLAPPRKEVERTMDGSLRTNRDSLIMTAVQGVVQPPSSREYSPGFDGKPELGIGMASINYTVSLGDPAFGWAEANHVEPDVTIQGRDRPNPGECALAILGCIGNKAEVLSGDAKGAKGMYIGRHAGSDDLVWFPKEAVEKLAINDRIQVKARGVGLKIAGFEDVRVNKLSPELVEKMSLRVEQGRLVVPVVMEVPGYLMGSGIGGGFIESVDYDIQTTCPEAVKEFGLEKLRLGDLVAIRDHYDAFGRGRYEGAVTIGVVIHGFSASDGHGPGLNPILSALPGRIKTRIDAGANTAYYLGIKSRT